MKSIENKTNEGKTRLKQKLPKFIFIDDKGKQSIDQLIVAELVIEKTNFFFTSKNLSGYFYNGQYWEQFNTQAIRDRVLKSFISKTLGKYATARLIRDILELLLSKALKDNLINVFNHRPSVVSFKNTAVDGDTMEFIRNRPALYILGGFDFEIKQGSCERTKKLFKQTLGENDQFMIEFFGSMFHRDYRPFQYMVILQGGAGTGKSYLVELMRTFIGEEMTTSLSLEQIAKDKFMTANLYGAYANIKSDLNNDYIPSFEIINNLTGSDSLQVQFKGENSFSFTNHAKLLFTANEAPTIKVNAGIRRRVKIMNSKSFAHVSQHDDDDNYTEYMKERGEFVYYAMEKFRIAKQNRKMSLTDDIDKTTNEWFLQGDDIQQWANEHLVTDSSINQRKDFLYFQFSQDLKDDGFIKPITKQIFYKRLSDLGYEFKKARSSITDNDDTQDIGAPANRIIGAKYVR